MEFLRALSVDSNWLAGPLDTGYIDRNMAQLVADPLPLAAPVSGDQQSTEGSLYAPMPGKIIRLQVATGDAVSRGQELQL